MEKWVTRHHQTKANAGKAWKVSMQINRPIDVDAVRIFLRHRHFAEYPLKHTVHTHQDPTKTTHMAVLPYHPTKYVHAHLEHQHAVHKYKHVTLINVDDVPEEAIDLLMPIVKTRVEGGSVFKHPRSPVVATLVQTIHEEEYGKTPVPNKTPRLVLCATWSATAPLAHVTRVLAAVVALNKQFDF